MGCAFALGVHLSSMHSDQGPGRGAHLHCLRSLGIEFQEWEELKTGNKEGKFFIERSQPQKGAIYKLTQWKYSTHTKAKAPLGMTNRTTKADDQASYSARWQFTVDHISLRKLRQEASGGSTHTLNPRIWDGGTGKSLWIWGQPGLL